MAYLEERVRNGKTYYYAKESYREEGKVKTRTLAYLGANKKEAEKQLKAINNNHILTEEELHEVERTRNAYSQLLAEIDEHTLQDIERDFFTTFVNQTNQLEGSTFTLKESKLLLEDNIVPKGKDLREVYEQVNTKKLFEAHQKKAFRITEKDIIAIHTLFVENIDKRVGYRTRPARILGSTTKTSPPEYIKTDMKLLIDWYKTHKKALHPLALAALFHAKFEQIHPFADGNGRVGRFIAYIMLEKHMPILFPSRVEYLDALEASQNKPLDSTKREDFEPILTYFMTAHQDTYNTFYRHY